MVRRQTDPSEETFYCYSWEKSLDDKRNLDKLFSFIIFVVYVYEYNIVETLKFQKTKLRAPYLHLRSGLILNAWDFIYLLKGCFIKRFT